MDHQEDSCSSSDNDSAPTPRAIRCAKCGREYATSSGLAKHAKTCGTRDRTACRYCGKNFTTFTGLRLHEIRVHKEADEAASRAGGPTNTPLDTFNTMAEIEAAAPKNAHILKSNWTNPPPSQAQARKRGVPRTTSYETRRPCCTPQRSTATSGADRAGPIISGNNTRRHQPSSRNPGWSPYRYHHTKPRVSAEAHTNEV